MVCATIRAASLAVTNSDSRGASLGVGVELVTFIDAHDAPTPTGPHPHQEPSLYSERTHSAPWPFHSSASSGSRAFAFWRCFWKVLRLVYPHSFIARVTARA
jgi:hypothetical protein